MLWFAVVLGVLRGTNGQYTLTNVTFKSFDTPSGEIPLYGTIVRPDGAPTSRPGAVLIHGSGPNNRWEEVLPEIAPFWDIATALANRGVVVLVYDKRSCTAAVHPICRNILCPTPESTDCVHVNRLVVDDFASDALAAVGFLKTQTGVDPNRVALIGHSQGTTIATHIASVARTLKLWDDPNATVTRPYRVGLLMGPGVAIDVVTTAQARVQVPVLEEALAYWEAQPITNPDRQSMIDHFNHTLLGMRCTIDSAVPQANLIKSGRLHPGQNAVVCMVGMWWDGGAGIPPGLYCPQRCGTGICAVGENTPECLEECTRANAVGACLSIPFAGSWLNISDSTNRQRDIVDLPCPVMALNGPQDLLVPPVAYQPLHDDLERLRPKDEVTLTVIPNITHLLTPTTGATAVDPRVLNAVEMFLLKS